MSFKVGSPDLISIFDTVLFLVWGIVSLNVLVCAECPRSKTWSTRGIARVLQIASKLQMTYLVKLLGPIFLGLWFRAFDFEIWRVMHLPLFSGLILWDGV